MIELDWWYCEMAVGSIFENLPMEAACTSTVVVANKAATQDSYVVGTLEVRRNQGCDNLSALVLALEMSINPNCCNNQITKSVNSKSLK
jgi:hypothetical protein